MPIIIPYYYTNPNYENTRNRRPFIRVSVTSRDSFKQRSKVIPALLDPGATESLIPKSFAKKLRLQTHDMTPVSFHLTSKLDKTEYAWSKVSISAVTDSRRNAPESIIDYHKIAILPDEKLTTRTVKYKFRKPFMVIGTDILCKLQITLDGVNRMVRIRGSEELRTGLR